MRDEKSPKACKFGQTKDASNCTKDPCCMDPAVATQVHLVPLCARHAYEAPGGLMWKNDPMNCAVCIQPSKESSNEGNRDG